MFSRGIALAVSCIALTSSCVLPADDTQEIIDNLVQAGFPRDDIMVVAGTVYVGRDAEVSLAASRELLQTGDSRQEQYHANIERPKVVFNAATGQFVMWRLPHHQRPQRQAA